MAFQRNEHRFSSTAPEGERSGAAGNTDRSGAVEPRKARRFDLFDASAPPFTKPSRAPITAIPLVIAALVIVAFARSFVVRALLPLALAAAAITLLVQGRRRKERALREREARRSLILQGKEVRFLPGGGSDPAVVLDRNTPFGATLLSTHRRDRLVLMLTSETSVVHVGTIVEPASVPILAPLFVRATTVAGEDAAFEAIGPDGEPMLLAPETFVRFVEGLVIDDPGCLDRVVVTDSKGAKVVLDEGELRIDKLAFDLTAPLEWRALVFQEPFGQVMTLYQGTWIRQNGTEVVLVSLLPSLGPILEVEPSEIATLDRAVLRDLRLMQANAESPPPHEQRHAIERLLMMPIRSWLDRAPRKSRIPISRRTPLH